MPTRTQPDLESDGKDSILTPTHDNKSSRSPLSHARTLSISRATTRRPTSMSLQSLQRVEASIPIEYRTLSIHVTHTHAADEGRRPLAGDAKRDAAVKDFVSLEWHSISPEEALQRLSASPVTGLDGEQAARRLAANGKNQLTPPPNGLFRKILSWTLGGFGSLLLVASIICFIAWKPLGEPNPAPANLALAIVLLIVLLIQAVFQAWQDISTSRIIASVGSLLPTSVTVLRDSQRRTIPATDLVTGDLVLFSLGQRLPADVRIIECSGDLRFDRSLLTGESEPVPGSITSTDPNFLESHNVGLQGTSVVGGSGVGLVVQCGDATVFGRIAKLSSSGSTGSTTLQREIFRFVTIIASLAIIVSVIYIIAWAAWLRRDYPGFISVPTLLVNVVSVTVAFIPEGLPVCITLSLARIASRLAENKVLCKSLSIVETLGAVTIICSDKTGTLTTNQMTCTNAAVFDTELPASEVRDNIDQSGATADALRQLTAISALCNSAVIETPATGNGGEPTIMGDATDSAILRLATSVADDLREFTKPWKEIFKIDFNSKSKWMLKLYSMDVSAGSPPPAPLSPHDTFGPGDYLLTLKGAPDVVLPFCHAVIDPSGGPPIPLDDAALARLTNVQQAWAAQGLRVLLLARRVVRGSDVKALPGSQAFGDYIEAIATEDLVIVGFVGLIDPLKPDIPHTVRVCREAHVRFYVVTGDFPITAVAIAASAGIVTNPSTIHSAADLQKEELDITGTSSSSSTSASGDDADQHRIPRAIVLTGTEMMELTEAQWDRLARYDECVFARTSPEQKLYIVKAFQQRCHIVAVTGDGVNDAPSLKAADIGIAMGSGSEVAREAADMVLMDSFSSIIIALEHGRLVFANLRKTVLYLLPAGSFSELMPILLNVFIGLPQVLSSIQMIIICCATDVAPALSLALEKPESGLLKQKPRNVKKDRLVDWRVLLHAYLFLGVTESCCAAAMAFWHLQRNGVPFSSLVFKYGSYPSALTTDRLAEAQSIYFHTLVIMQWGNLLATRTRRLSIFQHPPTRNPALFPAMLIALGLASFFSYIPFFRRKFGTHSVPGEYYGLTIVFAVGLLFIDEVRKFCVRRWPHSIVAKAAW